MMTVTSITIRVMEKHGIVVPQQLPESLKRQMDAEASYEAAKLRVARTAQTDSLSPARGIVVGLALSLIAWGLIWGIWRML